MKSIPLVITGIPEAFLPLRGQETLSHYRCQFPDCTHIFSQKASVCNHICHDHLNVALACIYCSGKENPKNVLVQCLCLGESCFVNIPKKTFPYSQMILLLQTYTQKLFHPPQVPPLILSLLILFCKGLKWLNNIWKEWPKLHLPNALLSKAQLNQAKNTKRVGLSGLLE